MGVGPCLHVGLGIGPSERCAGGVVVGPALGSGIALVEDAAHALKARGFLLIIATNQPDVPNGLTPRHEVDAMHDEIRRRLPIDDIMVCFHSENDNCSCRKPKPGMLLEAGKRHELDLASSYFVGDRWRDVEAGRVAGCPGQGGNSGQDRAFASRSGEYHS